MIRVPAVLAALVLSSLVVLGAGCGDDSPSPTAPTPFTSTRLFSGSLAAQGSRFYSFQLLRAGIVDFTLVSVTGDVRGSTLATVLGLGSGRPNGTDCELTTSTSAAPGLTSQFSVALAPGTYCVKIFDIGNLTTTVNFAVRIVHP
jgi:hypothetical protein